MPDLNDVKLVFLQCTSICIIEIHLLNHLQILLWNKPREAGKAYGDLYDNIMGMLLFWSRYSDWKHVELRLWKVEIHIKIFQIHRYEMNTVIQYIPINMRTVFALLCFVEVIHWLIFPYLSGLLHWHCGNLTIAPVRAKQPWWIWINTSCKFIMNDCITTTKQSTTKPCAYFLGYTVPRDLEDAFRVVYFIYTDSKHTFSALINPRIDQHNMSHVDAVWSIWLQHWVYPVIYVTYIISDFLESAFISITKHTERIGCNLYGACITV